MIQFDELIKLGQEDVNALVGHLKNELAKEKLVFNGLEVHVRAWVNSYLIFKQKD